MSTIMLEACPNKQGLGNLIRLKEIKPSQNSSSPHKVNTVTVSDSVELPKPQNVKIMQIDYDCYDV